MSDNDSSDTILDTPEKLNMKNLNVTQQPEKEVSTDTDTSSHSEATVISDTEDEPQVDQVGPTQPVILEIKREIDEAQSDTSETDINQPEIIKPDSGNLPACSHRNDMLVKYDRSKVFENPLARPFKDWLCALPYLAVPATANQYVNQAISLWHTSLSAEIKHLEIVSGHKHILQTLIFHQLVSTHKK